MGLLLGRLGLGGTDLILRCTGLSLIVRCFGSGSY